MKALRQAAAVLERLFPVIVPREYFSLGAPAPHHVLPAKELAVTWAVMHDSTATLYLMHDDAAALDAHGLPWRQRAMENLSNHPSGLATHEARDVAGQLSWISMQQADGLGSSRVLLVPWWRSVFPNGFKLAFPDRGCGYAVSNRLHQADLAELEQRLANTHRRAARPMPARLYEPAELAVPAEWFASSGRALTPAGGQRSTQVDERWSTRTSASGSA